MSRCGRVQLGAYVRYVAGGLLVAAALFKAVVPEADSTGSIRMRPFPRIGYVAMEGAVGVWIIIGRSVVLQHLVSTVAYLVFATIVCFRAISGEGTCGCFGAVGVSPWLMFVVDSTAAVFLIGTFPNRVGETGRSQLGSGALVPPITCGVLLSCVLPSAGRARDFGGVSGVGRATSRSRAPATLAGSDSLRRSCSRNDCHVGAHHGKVSTVRHARAKKSCDQAF
jgi:hypothetical protein